ncbi:MAG: efflux RND transporter permease subunit [Deltaproteobacteria bacterium]|nr:efflux RND transporter permease subunit [Deltaproteobacteria bacterium]
MNLPRLAVHRPVLTLMVISIIIILGIVSLTRLPVDLMPDITYPTLSIRTEYENASPEEIEELITRPMEEAMSAVPGVEEIYSVSSEGSSNVRVMFSWGTDLDTASNDVRDRIDRAMRRLPVDVDRPTLRKYDVASFPILLMGASSDLNPLILREIIEDQVKYRIERIQGVAALEIWGGLEREIHVNLDSEKIKALDLPLDSILSQIKSGNIKLPAGSLERGNFEITMRTSGEYENLEELKETVIAIRQDVPIQLKDIAYVEDSWVKITRIVRVNGKEGVRLGILKQSGTNTVEVAQKVLKEIEQINSDIPKILITPIIDTSSYIKHSITNVGSMALYGGLLAIGVLLFFLRNVRSTLIITTAIPISIIATFALMYFSGFTLNIITLGGLALGIGMLVDSAIVVLENIYRLREAGTNLEDAAVKGSSEVTAPIIASTLTTLAVFLPLVFVRGMSGILFKQLAFVVSFALLCSLTIALTLVPMMSAKLLTPTRNGSNSSITTRIYIASGLIFTKVEDGYKKLLHYALNHTILVFISALVLLGCSLLLIPRVGVEFMPSTDEGEVRITGEMAVGTRLETIDEKFKVIERIVQKEVPEIKSSVTSLGAGGYRSTGSHTGTMRIALTDLKDRSRSSDQIAADLRRKLSNIPGITVRTRAGQGLFMLRMSSGDAEKIQIDIRGYDLDIANELAKHIEEAVIGIDGVTDTVISTETGTPEEIIVIDRQKAASLKLTVSQIANMLQTVLSGTRASYYREGGDEFNIRVKISDAEFMNTSELLDLRVVNSTGEPVVLRNVVKSIASTGPTRIERKDQERIITLSVNISGRDMGSILADIRTKLHAIPVPGDFIISFGGDYEEQQKAFGELLLSLLLALVLVYMVMASLYESFLYPLVVMFSIPFAVIGVILILFLTNTTFNVQSYIGCIMLGGIVVNNAILLVDHINLLRNRDDMPLREAIEEAGRRRIRPILMTATTTILAMTPLAIGLGEGGEVQAPLARAVIGGLFSATLITLVIVPSMYLLFESKRRK